jgi:tyrosine-protein kinase Etk/Wzc
MADENKDDFGSDIDISEIFRVLWAGKAIILACGLLFAVLAIINVQSVKPVYEIDALLQLESKNGGLSIPMGLDALVGGQSSANSTTEVEILTSRMILDPVITKLGLDISAAPRSFPLLSRVVTGLKLPGPDFGMLRKYSWRNDIISVGEFEIPDDWFRKTFLITAGENGAYTLETPDGQVFEGMVTQRLADAALGFSLQVNELDAPSGREFRLMKRTMRDTYDALDLKLKVAETTRGSSLLRVSFPDTDVNRGIKIIEEVTNTYLTQNIARSSAKAESSLKFIRSQLPVSEQAVTEAQDALNLYRQKEKSVDIQYETRALLESASDIQKKLAELQLDEEQMKENYTVNHPVYQALLTQRKGLMELLNELNAKADNLPETQKDVFNLSRNLEVAQKVYLELLSREQELSVMKASSIGSVRVIDSAQASAKPISPKKTRSILISFLAGLGLSMAYVFWRSWSHKGIIGADQLEKMGLSVFATVNQALSPVDTKRTKGNLPILATGTSDDLVLEALRSLRTSLHFGMLDAKTNSVMFTSTAPGAGKSFISVNLATVIAQSGPRVCLIDADLRRGYLRRFFSVEKGTPGLAELLAKEKSIDEVLITTSVDNLTFIPTGRMPPNPSELLMRPDFNKLVEELNSRFDLLIFDAPPTLAVTDPVIMSRFMGASILVVRHIETATGEVEAVRKIFATAGQKLTGAILNGYRASAVKKLGGQEQYSSYRYSYQKEKDS